MNWWIVGASNLAVAAGFLGIGWTLRGRLRHRQALSIHDDVLQGLVTAKLSFELGEQERGMVALEQTLDSARHLVSELLEGENHEPSRFRTADLRRSATETG